MINKYIEYTLIFCVMVLTVAVLAVAIVGQIKDSETSKFEYITLDSGLECVRYEKGRKFGLSCDWNNFND